MKDQHPKNIRDPGKPIHKLAHRKYRFRLDSYGLLVPMQQFSKSFSAHFPSIFKVVQVDHVRNLMATWEYKIDELVIEFV